MFKGHHTFINPLLAIRSSSLLTDDVISNGSNIPSSLSSGIVVETVGRMALIEDRVAAIVSNGQHGDVLMVYQTKIVISEWGSHIFHPGIAVYVCASSFLSMTLESISVLQKV